MLVFLFPEANAQKGFFFPEGQESWTNLHTGPVFKVKIHVV